MQAKRQKQLLVYKLYEKRRAYLAISLWAPLTTWLPVLLGYSL